MKALILAALLFLGTAAHADITVNTGWWLTATDTQTGSSMSRHFNEFQDRELNKRACITELIASVTRLIDGGFEDRITLKCHQYEAE